MLTPAVGRNRLPVRWPHGISEFSASRRSTWLIPAGAAAGLVFGFAITRSPVIGLAVVGVAGVGLALFLLTNWSSPLLAVALLPLAFGLLTPRALEGAAEGLLVGVAAVGTVGAALRHDPRWRVGAACLLVPGVWLILGLNPNVPGASVALLGTRKSTLVFAALAIGALWPKSTAHETERLTVVLLALGGIVSLGLHYLAPSIENNLGRSSGAYTLLFHGKPRLEGIYSGPFHVALLGTFLVLRAWHINLTWGRERLRSTLWLAALGLPLIILAQVRTAYVSLLLGVLLTLIFSPRGRVRGRWRLLLRTAALGVVLVLFLVAGLGSNSALTSIPTIGSDARATNRIGSLSTGLSTFVHSPLVGTGPGSAGAADATDFVDRQHLTADDEFLAMLVEGGIVGVLALACAALTFSHFARDLTSPRFASAAALYCLAGFCATTNAFEAIPVSVFLAVLIGAAAARSST